MPPAQPVPQGPPLPARTPQPPTNGTQSHEAHDAELDDYLHIALSNRGVLMTPFHNMALMSPATSVADVATHLWAFEEAVSALAD